MGISRAKQSEHTPGSSKVILSLTGAEKTVLPMVFFRSMDAQLPDPILGDPYSQAILDKCEIDLNDDHFIRDDRFIEYVMKRTRHLDNWCQEFINAHPDEPITVLHLGCGLDCRYLRLRTGPNVRWIDVDQPCVVEARARLVPRPPGDYMLRALQVTRPGWLKDLPNDRPTLVVAEGLFPFLTPAEGKRAIHDVVSYFSRGEVITDHVSPTVARLSGSIKFLRTSGSRFQWGVGDPRREIEPLHPKLSLKGCLYWHDLMEEHPPIFGATMTKMMGIFLPGWKTNLKLLRFEYKDIDT